MNLLLSFGLICLGRHFYIILILIFTLYILLNIWTILTTKNYIFENVDLTFKSRTRQGRRVNSLQPDGVDLCQLH